MTDRLTIPEAASLLGCPRKALFGLLYAGRLRAAQAEPDGPLLIEAGELAEVQRRGMAWARAWGNLHPDPERVDLLTDWSQP